MPPVHSGKNGEKAQRNHQTYATWALSAKLNKTATCKLQRKFNKRFRDDGRPNLTPVSPITILITNYASFRITVSPMVYNELAATPQLLVHKPT